MKTFKVEVDFKTLTPLYQREKFYFATEDEADLFCAKVSKETNWSFTSPTPKHLPEIHTADSAFNWIVDEIVASGGSFTQKTD